MYKIRLIWLLFFAIISNLQAANSLSYSGRLVQSSGAPVNGPVNLRAELVYTNATSTVLCSQNLTGVALTKGVFHLKLDLNCTPKTMTQVLSETPNGESVAIRIIDQTNSKTYPLQAIHSVPFSKVAEQLPQMGASAGQALAWDGSKWAPTSVGTGNGTVMTVNTGTGLTGGPITTSGTISVAAGGITSTELAANSVTAAKISAGEITNSHISATANIPYSKLSIGVGEIPQDRINGLSASMSALIEDVIADAVTGKAPSQNAVYDALGLKADRSNVAQNITAASVVGLTAPTVGSAAANRDYVDNSAATLDTRITNEVSTLNTSLTTKYDKAGGVITGDVTLNTQLLFKGGSNFVTVKANSGTANYTMTLPTSAGTSGYVLQTDGAGVLSWVNPSSVTTGAGTVNSASITDGSIVDADINASANIAQSKIAGLSTSLASKEDSITAGTASQYWRGNKTWSSLQADVQALILNNYVLGLNSAVVNTDSLTSAIGKLQGQINATNTAITSLITTNVSEGTNLYFTEPRVLGTDLLGFDNTLVGPIVATDSVLQAFGRTQKQINDLTLSMAGNQWTAVNATDVYRTSGNAGVGTIPTDDPFRNVLEIGGTSDGGKLILSDTSGDYFSFNSDQFGYLHMYNKVGGSTYHVLSTKVSKVGIGSVNPEERLQLHIASGLDKHLLLTNATTGATKTDGHVVYLSGDDLVFNNQEASSGGKTYFRNDGVDTLTISETGNVGVGTITPTEKLEVSGNIKATQVCIGADCRSAWPTTSIAAGSVTTTEILDGTIATADIADGAVSLVKLGGTRDATKYLKGDNTWATFATDAINSVLSTFTVGTGTKPTVTNTDTVVGAFGKVQKTLNDINADYVSKTANQTINGTLAINSLTGFITVPTPVLANDAVNKSYVDGLLSWLKNGNDLYYNLGSVGIGTTAPNASAILDLSSTSKGFLPPKMTTAQRDAIASPASGLTIYNTTVSQLQVFDGAIWAGASSSSTQEANQAADINLGNGSWVDILSMSVVSGGKYLIMANGNNATSQPWAYFSVACRLYVGASIVDEKYFYYGATSGGSGPGVPMFHYAIRNLNTSDTVKISCSMTSDAATRTSRNWKISLVSLGVSNASGADNLGNHTASQNFILGSNWLSGDGDPEGIKLDGNGNVGVGVATPLAKLDVAGTIKASGSVGNMVANTSGQQMEPGDATLTTLRFDSAAYRIWNVVYGEVMRVLSSGRVGINTTTPQATLDVNGAIRMGTQATCDASTEGTQRYNSTTKQMEFCNGTSWNAMGANAVPSGAVSAYAQSTCPAGWIKANGQAVSRTTYANLFSAIGTTHGAGDGSTTFNVPELRGEFIRGWDDGRGVDSGRVLGSAQNATRVLRSYWGDGGWEGAVPDIMGHASADYDANERAYDGSNAQYPSGPVAGPTGAHVDGIRVRPRNKALLFCIKS